MAGRKDYILTFTTEFSVLLAGILVYKYAATAFSEQGFAEYALLRRVVSFIQPVLILGMGVGLPRYVALAGNQKAKKMAYLRAASFLILGFTVICAAILNLSKTLSSYLLFGQSSYGYLILPLTVMLAGLVLHAIVTSYYRGTLEMQKANLLQLINLGVVPVLSFYLQTDLLGVVVLTGTLWSFFALVFLLIIFARNKAHLKGNIQAESGELTRYGVQRVPGDLLISGFFAVPAILASHIFNITTAGYVAFGSSLLNMAGAVFGPICLILLPQASRIIQERDFVTLKNLSLKIIRMVTLLTVAGLLIFEVLAYEILSVYLGKINPEMLFIARITMFGVWGYAIYVSLRSILDAYYVKAMNTKNILYSFVLFILMSVIIFFLYPVIHALLISFVICQTILGILTYYETFKLIRLHLPS